MADFFGNNRRGSDRDGYDRRSDYDRRDDYDRRGDYDRTGNNFDRRYSSGGGGYFDRGDDTRRNVSRSTEERLNRALPPIGQPVRTQPTGQFVPPQQPAPQYAAPQPQNPALQSVPIGNVVLYSPKITATFSRLSTIFACMSPQSWSLQESATKTDNVFWTF